MCRLSSLDARLEAPCLLSRVEAIPQVYERSAIADYSALVALADVAHRYALVDKRVKIRNASEADAKLARASGPAVAAVADAIDTGEAVGDPDAAPLVADGAGDVEAGVELRAD